MLQYLQGFGMLSHYTMKTIESNSWMDNQNLDRRTVPFWNGTPKHDHRDHPSWCDSENQKFLL